MHRLKWDRQPNLRSSRWENTIEIQRNDIRDLLNENPSLRREFETAARAAYENAVLLTTGGQVASGSAAGRSGMSPTFWGARSLRMRRSGSARITVIER